MAKIETITPYKHDREKREDWQGTIHPWKDRLYYSHYTERNQGRNSDPQWDFLKHMAKI